MRIIAVVILTAASLVACSKKVEKKNESYSYDFTQNGCATGKHSFSSVSALCAGLADDARNHGCAFSLRYQMAKQHNCPQVSPKPAGATADCCSGGPSMEPREPRVPAIPAQLPGGNRERYSYQFTVNGCSTGLRVFDSKAALCEGLADDNGNNGCAGELRQQMFQEKGCK